MANIIAKIAQIRAAILGIDVRESIASGIESINTEVVSTTAKEAVLEGQFNSLVINAGSSNAEIVAGRTSVVTGQTFDTMGHRADGVDAQLADNTADLTNLGYNIRWNESMVVDNDWTVAIQTAIDNNEIVLIPAGTFNHTTLYLKHNTRLIGQGDVSILKNDTNLSSIVIGEAVIDVIMTTLISNLCLMGNNTGTCPLQDGIEFVSTISAYAVIDRVKFTYFGRHCIHGGHVGHVNNVEIKSCSMRGNIGDGIHLEYKGSGAQINAIWIHHNDISLNNNGIFFYGNNVIVDTNTIQANRNYGISLSDRTLDGEKLCWGSAIKNNYFELNASDVPSDASVIGIFSGYSALTITTNKVLRNLAIENNYSGEYGAKYRSFIYAEDLKTSEPSNKNCLIVTKNNYSELPLLFWNKDSALSDGCVIDESYPGVLPPSMVDILPAWVEVRGTTEGVWIPDIKFGGANVGATYLVSKYGLYTKIGHLVYFSCGIGLLTKGTSVGGIVIEGLPYPANNGTGIPCSCRLASLNATATGFFSGMLLPGESGVRLEKLNAGALVTMSDTDFTDNSLVYLSGHYMT